jgi:peptidyl-prolyl cis-trans isomerase C
MYSLSTTLSAGFRLSLLVPALLFSSGLAAAEPTPEVPELDPAVVLAYKGGVTVTQVEIDAVFNKLPAGERLLFIRDGAKVDQLINSLLQRKLVSREAVAAGYDQDPLIAARLELERQKELADAWLQKVMADAPPADFDALAHEQYLANPDAWRSEEVLDVSHILLGTENRGEAEAQELAASLRQQLETDPTRFDAFVVEYSDDPVKENNGGRYADMRRGMMVRSFEKAAFALDQPGQISQPVKTEYGYHIIRLNARSGDELQEYSAVKEQAVARAEQRYLDSYRQNYLIKILSDPVVIPDGAVEIMAKRHFGENLELAPDFSGKP